MLLFLAVKLNPTQRVFKSARFVKAAKKACNTDESLCLAIEQVLKGWSDALGGGVYKKRLNDNLHRSIILEHTGSSWIYQYLFAKKDRSNIDQSELLAFRKLALAYATLTPARLAQLLQNKELLEICHEC